MLHNPVNAFNYIINFEETKHIKSPLAPRIGGVRGLFAVRQKGSGLYFTLLRHRLLKRNL